MNDVKKDGAIKIQLIKIANASGECWLGFVVFYCCFGLSSLLLVMLASDHKVRCYYMNTLSTSSGLAYRIKADIDWKTDEVAFASADENKTLKVITTLKQCAPTN